MQGVPPTSHQLYGQVEWPRAQEEGMAHIHFTTGGGLRHPPPLWDLFVHL